MADVSDTTYGPAAEAFGRFTARVHSVLPGFLGRWLPKTFVGFAMINLSTFGLDLVLLWLTHHIMGMPYPFAVSISFGIAAAIAFGLNKVLNFRARGDVGKQSGKYVLVMVSNYLIWIVGFSSFLEWAGVHYLVSRVLAGAAEGVYIYLCSRLWVFRRRARVLVAAAPTQAVEPAMGL